MIVTEKEIAILTSQYSNIDEIFSENLKILKGKDDELNDYHLGIESLVNRFEKSLWDMLRIFTPMTCKECILKYYGEDPMIKGKFIPLNNLHKMVKEKIKERSEKPDTFNNILTKEDYDQLSDYLDTIYPFFAVRNSLAHQIKDHLKNRIPIHPLHSGIMDEVSRGIFKNRAIWRFEIIKGIAYWRLYKITIEKIARKMNGLTDEHFNLWADLAIL